MPRRPAPDHWLCLEPGCLWPASCATWCFANRMVGADALGARGVILKYKGTQSLACVALHGLSSHGQSVLGFRLSRDMTCCLNLAQL